MTKYLLQDYFSFRAQERPDAVMINHGGQITTYGEMESYTNRLARFLLDLGVLRGEKIPFYIEKSINSFRALISVLKSDGVYIPLDYDSPLERTRSILTDTNCRFIICDDSSLKRTVELLRGVERLINIVVLGAEGTQVSKEVNGSDRSTKVVINVASVDLLSQHAQSKRSYANIDSDPAYIIYTSGSTGIPKGVMISHRSVIDYSKWTIGYFDVKRDDKLSSHAPLHFDLSVFDVYTAFTVGASLHTVNKSDVLFPIDTLNFIREHEITIWCSVPSLLTYMMKTRVLGKKELPSLRAITFCGEVMPTTTLIGWMRAYPNVRYINQYGPAETTCASMYYEIDKLPEDPRIPIPIGKAMDNTNVFSLDGAGKTTAVGEMGELYIGGSGVGLGYWRDKVKTENVFIQNPIHDDFREVVYRTGDFVKLRKDGYYDFLGRTDTQIKYMGHRIELGEIERSLQVNGSIVDSAVVSIDDEKRGGIIIVAFLCLSEGGSIESVKKDLKCNLPTYMIPKRFIILDEIPISPNGKTNYLLLKGLYKEVG
jgi:amino acid adenylation domain-containing protein